MNTIVRYSTKNNISDAVNEISEGITMPKLILFFSQAHSFKETAEKLHEHFPDSICMGTTTHHTICGKSFLTDSVSAAFFPDGIECSCNHIPDIKIFPLKYTQRIKNCMNAVSSAENTVCLEFTTAGSCCEELAITALDSVCSEKNIPVAGGTAGVRQETEEESYVSLNGNIYKDSTVFAFIHNLHGRIRIFKENIYVPTEHTLTATAVDLEKRIVKEFNGEPAADALSKELDCSSGVLAEHLAVLPVGRITGNELYISAFEKINEDKSVSWSSRIFSGTKVSLLKPGDFRKIAENTVERIKSAVPAPSAVFLIHCDARTELYIKQNFMEEFMNIYGGTFRNLSGFSSHGEQMGTVHLNHTMLAIVFE